MAWWVPWAAASMAFFLGLLILAWHASPMYLCALFFLMFTIGIACVGLTVREGVLNAGKAVLLDVAETDELVADGGPLNGYTVPLNAATIWAGMIFGLLVLSGLAAITQDRSWRLRTANVGTFAS